MSVETDANGRIYLSSDLRQRYGEKFHVVEYQNRIELIPIDENPLQAAREAVGDAFEGESVESIRETARRRAEENAERRLERRNSEQEPEQTEAEGDAE